MNGERIIECESIRIIEVDRRRCMFTNILDLRQRSLAHLVGKRVPVACYPIVHPHSPHGSKKTRVIGVIGDT